VLAEGVETEAQRQILSHEGCDPIQGHLLGAALPIENYEAIINAAQTHGQSASEVPARPSFFCEPGTNYRRRAFGA
jgi:predicted signal transduction protein with EAL and GGDEF domain